jgi:hypothetical protein
MHIGNVRFTLTIYDSQHTRTLQPASLLPPRISPGYVHCLGNQTKVFGRFLIFFFYPNVKFKNLIYTTIKVFGCLRWRPFEQLDLSDARR